MTRISLLSLLLLPLLFTGCATPKYACGVPNGIGCKSLSEVHRIAKDGSLKMKAAPNNRDEAQSQETPPSQIDVLNLGESDITETVSDTEPTALPRAVPEVITVTPGMPILTPPRTMRLWIARWPDEDGTLHDETYLYLRLDNGRWLMEGM